MLPSLSQKISSTKTLVSRQCSVSKTRINGYCCTLLSFCLTNPSCFTLNHPQSVCWACTLSTTLFHTHSLCHFTHSHMEAAKYNHCQVQHSRPMFSPQIISTRICALYFFSSLWSLFFLRFVLSDCGYIRIGRKDAGGEREQRCRPSGQAEEEVPQPVDPQDQQHWAGPRSAERHAGGTGDDSHINTVKINKNTKKRAEKIFE